MWRLRRAFWNWLVTFKYRHNKPKVVPPPVPEEQPIIPVPFAAKFPRIPIDGIVVADHVPRTRPRPCTSGFASCRPGSTGPFHLCSGACHPSTLTPVPRYTARTPPPTSAAFQRRCARRSTRGDLDLGHLSVASPYACYLERDVSGGFRWDLSTWTGSSATRVSSPARALVEFGRDPSEERLVPVRIDCELGSCKPGTPIGPRRSAWPCARPPPTFLSSATSTGSIWSAGARSPCDPQLPSW